MKSFFTTSRRTGLLYLGLVVTGVFAFLFARAQLYVEGDAAATASNLLDNESLARFGIAMEVAVAGFQALLAVWFFKLFRKTSSFAATVLTAFGMINAAMILVASAFWLSALHTALAGQPAAITQMLFGIHENIWVVAGLFFGLWLLPMGYLVLRSKMPNALGWVLCVGGIGYILSAFVSLLAPNVSSTAKDILTLPASIGEFWIVIYLLFWRFKE